MYELTIKPKDWFFILLTGVVFSSLLSMLGYSLLDQSYANGLFFGAILGFCITLYSLVLITYMNTKILLNTEKKYWNFIAAMFSYLSGFLGFLSGVVLAQLFGITLLEIILQKLYTVALIVGVLTYVMGAIIYSFVNMRNQKEKTDYEYIQSRLKSLETQLNPHFIFNALNSIAELIHQDQNKAEDAVLQMSKFLRNTMNEKALIPLAEELNNVHSYLELENIRFSDQLSLKVDEKVPSWSVPKFSLQLLVENSLKHGFKGNILHIEIKFDRKKKNIVVSNDGHVMQNQNFGVGLNNLKQRLELLCQGDITVSDPNKSEFTIVLGRCNEDTHS